MSPLLFNLALEHLARFLEDSDLYRGISVGRQEVTLFADDILLFLSNPSEQLKSLLQTMSHFGKFSGYRINTSKSELSELGPRPPSLSWPNMGVDIQLAPVYITYLGIKIGKRPDTLYLNYTPLINKIVLELVTLACPSYGPLSFSQNDELCAIVISYANSAYSDKT